MNESDHALCLLISEANVEQFKRFTADECFADQILGHLAFCSRHIGPLSREKFEILVEALVSREGIKPSGEKWKYDIVAAQTIEALAVIGIVRP